MLSIPSEAVSLTGEFTFDVKLTSCGAPDAAVTAALAVDFGVTATVAQSMQVMAFFLSDTTTGGTTSNGTRTTNATVAGKRCDTPQPNRHSDPCVGCC